MDVLHAVDYGLGELRVGALILGPDPFFTSRLQQLAALSVRHSMPAIYSNREFPDAGGLMNYGISITDVYRLVGVYLPSGVTGCAAGWGAGEGTVGRVVSR